MKKEELYMKTDLTIINKDFNNFQYFYSFRNFSTLKPKFRRNTAVDRSKLIFYKNNIKLLRQLRFKRTYPRYLKNYFRFLVPQVNKKESFKKLPFYFGWSKFLFFLYKPTLDKAIPLRLRTYIPFLLRFRALFFMNINKQRFPRSRLSPSSSKLRGLLIKRLFRSFPKNSYIRSHAFLRESVPAWNPPFGRTLKERSLWFKTLVYMHKFRLNRSRRYFLFSNRPRYVLSSVRKAFKNDRLFGLAAYRILNLTKHRRFKINRYRMRNWRFRGRARRLVFPTVFGFFRKRTHREYYIQEEPVSAKLSSCITNIYEPPFYRLTPTKLFEGSKKILNSEKQLGKVSSSSFDVNRLDNEVFELSEFGEFSTKKFVPSVSESKDEEGQQDSVERIIRSDPDASRLLYLPTSNFFWRPGMWGPVYRPFRKRRKVISHRKFNVRGSFRQTRPYSQRTFRFNKSKFFKQSDLKRFSASYDHYKPVEVLKLSNKRKKYKPFSRLPKVSRVSKLKNRRPKVKSSIILRGIPKYRGPKGIYAFYERNRLGKRRKKISAVARFSTQNYHYVTRRHFVRDFEMADGNSRRRGRFVRYFYGKQSFLRSAVYAKRQLNFISFRQTTNNFFITVFKRSGQLLISRSAGVLKLKGPRRSTPEAASDLMASVVATLKERRIGSLNVVLRTVRVSKHVRSALNTLKDLYPKGIGPFAIRLISRSHNGLRARKRTRG